MFRRFVYVFSDNHRRFLAILESWSEKLRRKTLKLYVESQGIGNLNETQVLTV